MEESKVSKIMTGYIHYGESDDLTQMFNILNEFKKNNGLKYSHQSKAGMIFFNISNEYLDAFSKVRPFKISKFESKTEYKCDESTSKQLINQKDSFLRMIWDEDREILIFQSRTPPRVHSNLVKRIFKDSGVEFQRDSYSVIRKFNSSKIENTNESNIDEKFNTDTKDQSQSTPNNFQRVEKKTKNKKIFKDFKPNKPKVRGSKFTTPK